MTTERRSKVRYPLELNVRYQTLEVTAPMAGAGQTLNMSSSGLLMMCQTELSEGTRVRVTVEWPSLLNGNTPLQLVTVGAVVRHTESSFAIAFENYQFRTMSRKAKTSIPLEMPALASVAVGGTGLPAGDTRIGSPHGRGSARSLSLVPAKS
jgi:hypothetical protein